MLTNEKTKAYMDMYSIKLGSHPEFLGLLPSASLEDQLTAGFDLWLFEYKLSVMSKVSSLNKFVDQVTLLRSDHQEWMQFLHKWKLQRIFHRDSFLDVWAFVVRELQITVKTDTMQQATEEDADLNITSALAI